MIKAQKHRARAPWGPNAARFTKTRFRRAQRHTGKAQVNALFQGDEARFERIDPNARCGEIWWALY